MKVLVQGKVAWILIKGWEKKNHNSQRLDIEKNVAVSTTIFKSKYIEYNENKKRICSISITFEQSIYTQSRIFKYMVARRRTCYIYENAKKRLPFYNYN